MASDNRLGAPTEGLGQTVTFTANPQGSQRQGVQGRSGPNYGTQGDARARSTAQPVALPDVSDGDRTIKVLQKLGGEILRPHIERERNQAFMRGVQRAASGEAVKEIVDEQPWYASVLGDTPVVEGARAFSGASMSQKAAQAIEAQMPELRKLDPDSFQKKVAEQLSALANSGDADTDLLAQQGFLQAMPGLMKAHTKEHIGWQQETFTRNVQDAQAAASARLTAKLGSMLKQDTAEGIDAMMVGNAQYLGEADALEAKIEFVKAFAQPPGLPDDAYDKITTGSVMAVLSSENMHAFNVLEESGVIASLSPDSAKKIRDYADRIETRIRANLPEPMIRSLATIKTLASRGETPEELAALTQRVAEFNKSWQVMTGSRDPYIKGESQAEYRNSLMEGIIDARRKADEAARKAQEQFATEAQKAEAKEQAETFALMSITQGYSLEGVKAEDQRTAWNQLRTDPVQLNKARILQFNMGTFDKVGRDTMQGRIGAALDTDNADAVEDFYQNQFLPLVNAHPQRNPATALAYVGEKYQGFMAKYHEGRAGTSGPTAANQVLGLYLTAKGDPAKAPSKDEASKAIGSLLKGRYTSMFGSDALDPRFHNDVAAMLRPKVIGDPEQGAEVALRTAQAEGLRIMGGFYWHERGNPGVVEAVAAAAGIEVAPETVRESIGPYIKEQVKALGLEDDSATVVYGMRNGKAVLHLMGRREGEPVSAHTIDPEAIAVSIKAKRKKDASKSGILPGLTGPAFGPKITFKPAEGAKSIYDR